MHRSVNRKPRYQVSLGNSFFMPVEKSLIHPSHIFRVAPYDSAYNLKEEPATRTHPMYMHGDKAQQA
jgi:hypothetical protein